MLAVIDPTRRWRGWTLPDAGRSGPYQTLEGLDPTRRWLWSPEVNRSASCDAGSRVTGQLAHFKPNTFLILHTTYSCTADCIWSITDGGEGGWVPTNSWCICFCTTALGLPTSIFHYYYIVHLCVLITLAAQAVKDFPSSIFHHSCLCSLIPKAIQASLFIPVPSLLQRVYVLWSY